MSLAFREVWVEEDITELRFRVRDAGEDIITAGAEDVDYIQDSDGDFLEDSFGSEIG